jgi:hypothetical protein
MPYIDLVVSLGCLVGPFKKRALRFFIDFILPHALMKISQSWKCANHSEKTKIDSTLHNCVVKWGERGEVPKFEKVFIW